jgi:hypothetical protein
VSGFEFCETMAGSYHLLAAPDAERPISFTIRVRSRPWLGFLRRREAEIEGEVDAEGFADHRLLRGTLDLDVLRTRKLRYAFEFNGNDGQPYVFRGEKVLELRKLARTISVLPGSIEGASGAEVGRATLRFDFQTQLLPFLRSFRPSV